MSSFIIVAGPTGSGKTKIATSLAKLMNGSVINVDSVQIYKDFEIGSAAPTAGEREGVDHHLFGELSPSEPFDVAKYIRMANEKCKLVMAQEKLPIFSGGTSLYISALLNGLAELPPCDAEFRESLVGIETRELYLRLQALSPKRAKEISENDRVRIERALETLRVLSDDEVERRMLAQRNEELHNAIIVVPVWERAKLYDRINRRTELIVEKGIIEETERIISEHGDALPPLRTIGYKEALSFIRGTISREELLLLIAKSTRRFAKRQMTWLRNEPEKRGWTVRPSGLDSKVNLVGELSSFSKPGRLKHFEALNLNLAQLVEELKNRPISQLSKTEIWFVNAEPLM